MCYYPIISLSDVERIEIMLILLNTSLKLNTQHTVLCIVYSILDYEVCCSEQAAMLFVCYGS